MRTSLRSAAFITLTITFVAGALTLAAPAGADELVVTDATGDVVDADTGAATPHPPTDIVDVTIRSEMDSLEVVVDVNAPVSFEDADWMGGEYDVTVWLRDPERTGPFDALSWSVEYVDGVAVGALDHVSTRICTTTVESLFPQGAYVFRAGPECVRLLPRRLQVAVDTTHDDGSREVIDEAPTSLDDSEIVAAAANGEVVRLAGTDRILTAVELSRDQFADGAAGGVVLASGYSFPDALAGGPLARAVDGPMLLTAATTLDERTLAEMRRVLPAGGTVHLLGGTAALAESVARDVRAAGFTVERVAGPTRFETALAIVDAIDAVAGGHGEVLVASGRSFTDALVAGAAAADIGGVVVLTDGPSMPAATAAFLTSDTEDETAIGIDAATAAGSGMARIVGATAAELSVNVVNEIARPSSAVAVASAADFPDSLAGGPHIAHLDGALLLTDPATLSPEVRTAVEDMNGHLREVVVYGGTAAVSRAVESALIAAL